MRGAHKETVEVERSLRQRHTDAERKLWFALRDRRLDGFKFVRQEAIAGYVVDFVCRERKLIVEADGGQHADNPDDRKRDKILKDAGYRIVRFWNNDILGNIDGVLLTISASLRE